MAKQTFTTGQVLTAAQQNSLQANDFNQTVSVKTANYSLLAADKGTRIEFNTSGSVTCTVNSGQFDAGDTLIIQNRGAGTATITAGTATVNTSASLALSQYSAGTLYFVSDSAALFFGDAAGISASIVDAKGDLIVGTADNTVARLAVGTNGHTLVADSSTATGLAYAAPSTPTWTSYTPTYTNVTVGNGTVVAEYAVSGDIVFIRYLLTFGSTTSVTGTIRIGLPSGYNANTTLNGIHFSGGINGWVRANDNSVNNSVYAQPGIQSSTEWAINTMRADFTYVEGNTSFNATVPFTWATSDQLQAVFYYRKA